MSKIREYFFRLARDREQGGIASLVKAFLFILSLAYGLIVRWLIFFRCRKPVRLDCKVISVGNLALGGTGKTTIVYYLAKYLAEQGRRPVVLSRGKAGGQDLGDEPRMLSAKLPDIPVIAGTDRIRGARQAIEKYGADTVILDDGLQQWHIEKDLEIVAIDAGCPFGNGRLLPRGILRQPLSTLAKAGVFVLTKTNLYPATRAIKETLGAMFPAALVIETLHQPAGFYDLADPGRRMAAEELRGRRAVLFSGIGDPESFDNLAGSLGVKPGLSLRFADHHRYTKEDLKKIVAAAKDKDCDVLITTEKDAARFYHKPYAICPLPIMVLRIELGFKDDAKDRFHNRLRLLYSL